MAGLSDADKIGVLNALLRGTAYSGRSTLYIGLHTGDPGSAGTTNELSYSGYVRQEITFAEADASGSVNDIDVMFAEAPETIGDITHFSLHTESTGGDFVLSGTLSGDLLDENLRPKIESGALTIDN